MEIKLPDGRALEMRFNPINLRWAWERCEDEWGEGWWKDETLEEVKRILDPYIAALRTVSTADQFLDRSSVDYSWVIPDMFELGDRLVITGVEGNGKSTLIMQWLVQVACGIHPLTGKSLEWAPRTLLLDLEYGDDELRRRINALKVTAGRAWNPENIIIKSRPDGINLLAKEDQDWLYEVVTRGGIEVLGITPLYKTFVGDETDDVVANKVTSFLNTLRDNCVLITEAHVPHAGPSGRRPERPIGSSVWMRWPEFGIFLASNGELRHFRGPRDASREWPAALKRGGKWPWTAVSSEQGEDLRWKKLRAWAVKNNRKPTTRLAAEILGVSQPTATRIMKEHANDWPDSLIHADSSAS